MITKSEKLAVFDLLGVPPGGIGVNRVNITHWGTQIQFECFYDWDAPRQFQLTFERCLNIGWQGYEEESASDADTKVADVIGIYLGEGQYRAKAFITTDLFEIGIMYRSMYARWCD